MALQSLKADQNLIKNKTDRSKAASHKEVGFLLVGTGVPDGPQRYKCNAEDKDNPDRIEVGVIFILFDKLEFG